MDRETAIQVLKTCNLASVHLNDLLRERISQVSKDEFDDLRRRVGETLAYMHDFLIEPAIDQYPDINPYT